MSAFARQPAQPFEIHRTAVDGVPVLWDDVDTSRAGSAPAVAVAGDPADGGSSPNID